MAKSLKKQPVTLESMAQTMAAGFLNLDKKIDNSFTTLDKKIGTKFGILDKKIDTKFGILDKKIGTKFGVLDKKIGTKFGVLDKKIDTRFGILDDKIVALDKKIDDKFVVLDKKIEGQGENLLLTMQRGFLEQIDRIGRVERDVADLKDGQERIEVKLAHAARNIDLMDLRADVEILKRKV